MPVVRPSDRGRVHHRRRLDRHLSRDRRQRRVRQRHLKARRDRRRPMRNRGRRNQLRRIFAGVQRRHAHLRRDNRDQQLHHSRPFVLSPAVLILVLMPPQRARTPPGGHPTRRRVLVSRTTGHVELSGVGDQGFRSGLRTARAAASRPDPCPPSPDRRRFGRESDTRACRPGTTRQPSTGNRFRVRDALRRVATRSACARAYRDDRFWRSAVERLRLTISEPSGAPSDYSALSDTR